jgi:DNA-binding NtrC family response regulator
MSSQEDSRVLIVDDEEGMQTALREVLSRRSIRVDCAGDGESALELIDRTGYSLVLSDVRMPGITGLQLLEKARARRPEMPFVMMTAYGSIEDAVEAMKMGARDYLIKPFSFETVEAVVGGILEGPGPGGETSRPAAGKPGNGGSKPRMVAVDVSMKRLLGIVEEIADGTATVLIQGESGVGKEVLAREIHRRGGRREKPFVAVNCAALPEGLLESELFGHEKGSFTGAILTRKGKFEQANEGMLLLDEISEMPLSLQAKLLRVLQEREIEPIGSARPVPLDIRVVATTNRSLSDWVKEGRFREDLFYRLNVITLSIPPLRERAEDILPLAEMFLEKHCRGNNRPRKRMSADLQRYLLEQPWRGNVRELENFIERAVLLCREEEISVETLFLDGGALGRLGDMGQDLGDWAARRGNGSSLADQCVTLEEMEKRMILKTLDRVGGNRTRAAEQLGVSVRTVRNKLHQYGLQGV